jgi:hypothetical protein
MPLSIEVEKELLEKVGVEATEKAKVVVDKAEKELTQKAADLQKGLMTEKSFEDFKKEQLEPINKMLEKLEGATKEQGNKINTLVDRSAPNSKSIEQFIMDKKDELIELRKSGKYIEVTGAELKAAGVQTVATSIPTASAYAPGVGGPDLNIFDIARNPNFITSRVDLGNTNQSRLAWANELDIQGAAAVVAEGALKPQVMHRFEIETSNAKKIAGWVEMTEEFDQDLPQFSTRVRRMLQDDVIRAWDDAIQTDVIAVARPFEITGLNGKVQAANYWDALLAEMGQVGFYNFQPNTVGINWLTNVLLNTEKASTNEYLLPPFVADINALKVYANKLAVNYGLVGDLKQYKVDIYKDFVLKMGWINDEFIYNKFAIVGEIRYHSYISAARKKALVYDSLITIDGLINTP